MDTIRRGPYTPEDGWLDSPGIATLFLGIGAVVAIWAMVVILAWL